ncbi:MAG TPA: BLUF domain-containing protein [Tepidisphaeraceae bacterium]|nr:BLUF domain-containing protein [Tepidisphaeraceae bacterium]
MSLAQLVYVSRRGESIRSNAALGELVAASAAANRGRFITGVLLCGGDNLLQVLEGEREEIMYLFERIRGDRRHSAVQLLVCKDISRRLFPGWQMELVDLERRQFIDPERLRRLLDDVRAAADTALHSVEARVLLHDFRQQLATAA